jgi:hypothetical protein
MRIFFACIRTVVNEAELRVMLASLPSLSAVPRAATATVPTAAATFNAPPPPHSSPLPAYPELSQSSTISTHSTTSTSAAASSTAPPPPLPQPQPQPALIRYSLVLIDDFSALHSFVPYIHAPEREVVRTKAWSKDAAGALYVCL